MRCEPPSISTGFAQQISPSLFSGSIPTFLGLALPLALGAFSVPYIIHKLGVERFGVLTVIWAVVGYFSLFDFGISRALTKRVAELGGEEKAETLGSVIKVALYLLLALGVIAGGLTWLVYGFAIKLGYLHEGREAFRSMLYLAIGMPLLLVGLGLRGVLEGKQCFGPPNWSRVLLGVMTFGVPIPLLSVFPSLDVLVAALVFGRLLIVLLQGRACLHELRLAALARVDAGELMELLRFGGWMTVSNLISPIMVFIDRFVVGASVYSTSLAYYTAPFEAVTRLLVVPGALTTAMFPKLAIMHGKGGTAAGHAMLQGMTLTLSIVAPVVVGLQFFAADVLRVWLGPDFALNGALPLQLIAWGVLFNAIAQLPFAYLQSAGRPDWIARLHLVELPIYLWLLFWMLGRWGIPGVAAAWLIRAIFDQAMLSGLALRHAGSHLKMPFLNIFFVMLFLGAQWCWVAALGFKTRVMILILVIVVFAVQLIKLWSVVCKQEGRFRE